MLDIGLLIGIWGLWQCISAGPASLLANQVTAPLHQHLLTFVIHWYMIKLVFIFTLHSKLRSADGCGPLDNVGQDLDYTVVCWSWWENHCKVRINSVTGVRHIHRCWDRHITLGRTTGRLFLIRCIIDPIGPFTSQTFYHCWYNIKYPLLTFYHQPID